MGVTYSSGTETDASKAATPSTNEAVACNYAPPSGTAWYVSLSLACGQVSSDAASDARNASGATTVTPVSGLGDSAAWTDLMGLWVRQQNREFAITFLNGSSDHTLAISSLQPAATQMAQAVLNRL